MVINTFYSIGRLQKRLLVIILLITFLFGAIFLRLSYLQLINGQWLQAKALDQWTRDVPIKAKRGTIYDANGSAIAVNYATYDVYVRAKNVEKPKELAEVLSRVLDLDYSAVYKKVTNKSVSESSVKLQVTDDKVKEIISYGLKGVVFSENSKRYYPYSDLFTQVLGYTTVDGIGQSGLEAYYNNFLKGEDGYVLTQADVQGIELDNKLDMYIPSISGMNIKTTLNATIQKLLEQAMSLALVEQKAKKVSGIVMNPNTGEILAMGSVPNFDLNNIPRDNISALFDMSKNSLVVDIYEPGSTFKILTSAISLDEGIVTTSDSFYDPGYRIVDGEKIKCWKTVGHGQQTFTDGFCNSCNAVFIDLALRLGLDTFYKRFDEFGLGQLTGIDFLGEASGLLMQKDSVKTVDLARMGFGQAIAVSPIQLATALSATVNGGNLMTPYLVSEITDVNGDLIYATSPKKVRSVIKSNVSATICSFLEEAVSRPLGKYTFIPGYSVGGKTGTTQKYVDGKISGTYIASFFGVFPCDNPECVILFIVDEPTAGSYYGSIAATPYAKKIFEGIIDYYNYKPVAQTDEIEDVQMPNLVGMSLSTAINALIEIGLAYEIGGDGGVVTEQFPPPNTTLKKGQVVQINTT